VVRTSGAAPEACDDGNTVDETCTWAQDAQACTICNSTCQSVAGATPFCGDGAPQTAFENCDDRNDTCGTCSSDCQTLSSLAATGSLAVIKANDFDEDDTFTLNDGVNPAIVFEFTKDATLTNMSHVPVVMMANQNAATVKATVIGAINSPAGRPLLITASAGSGALVNLVHDFKTTAGNVAISEAVTDADFGVTGMSGGTGGNCASGQACNSNDDCVPTAASGGTVGSCVMNACQ